MMKQFILVASFLVLLVMIGLYAVFVRGFYINLNPQVPEAVFRTEEKEILRLTGQGEWESFSIRGVDLSANIPNHYAMDYAADCEDYTRWLEWIG